MALVEVRNLIKSFPFSEGAFGGAKGEVRAVNDVSLDIEPGETLGLVGESGSGKSTLGRLLLRLIEPTSGTVRFDGQDVLSASGREMRRLRRDMQIIFQDPFGSLDPRMRVGDIITEPLITFYEAIMRPRWADLELGLGAQVWADTRAAFGSQVAGPHFEALCREFARAEGRRLFGAPVG